MKTISILSFLFISTACNFRKDQQYLATIKKLPAFQIISLDSCQYINTSLLPSGTPMLFFYFDPNCEHCQKETQILLTNIRQLANTRIYFLTNGENSDLMKFCKTFRTDTVANIIVGKDYEYSFYKTYLPPTVPYLAIYNTKNILTKIYIGETSIESIVNATRIKP